MASRKWAFVEINGWFFSFAGCKASILLSVYESIYAFKSVCLIANLGDVDAIPQSQDL